MDPHFPPEIWKNIIAFATFTVTSLNVMHWEPWPESNSPENTDPALCYRSTLYTKMALTLVSRRFREMSLEYFYEMVQLFNTHNARLLLDTIHSHITPTIEDIHTGNSPAKWIKCIIIALDPEPDGESDTYSMDEVLKKIFPFCINLAAFGWKSTDIPHSHRSDQSVALLAAILLTITTLQWHRDTTARTFHALRNHAALRNLRVSTLVCTTREGDPDVTMPFVSHLDVRTTIPNTLPLLCWNLPSLTHLTLDRPKQRQYERLLAKCRDNIRSIYITDKRQCMDGYFPQLLTSMPKLKTFSYAIAVNTHHRPQFASSWLGVRRHPSVTHIYLFCRGGRRNPAERAFSKIRDFFSCHLQPLTAGQMMPLTITIMDTELIFRMGDFPEDGYDSASKQTFFDDLSASLSSGDVQCIVK